MYSSEELYAAIRQIYDAFDETEKLKAGEPKSPKNGLDQMRQYFRKIKIIAKDHDSKRENYIGQPTQSVSIGTSILSGRAADVHSSKDDSEVLLPVSPVRLSTVSNSKQSCVDEQNESICTRDSDNNSQHPIESTSNVPTTVIPERQFFNPVNSGSQPVLKDPQGVFSPSVCFGSQPVKDHRTLSKPAGVTSISSAIEGDKNMVWNSVRILVRVKMKFLYSSAADLFKNVCMTCGFPIDEANNCTLCLSSVGRKKDWFVRLVIADHSTQMNVVLKGKDASHFFGCTANDVLATETISAQIKLQVERYSNDARFFLLDDVISFDPCIDKPVGHNLFVILFLIPIRNKSKNGKTIWCISLRS